MIEATSFMPFGSARSHTGASVSDYKFTDQEFDAETGLYNYNARLYDPIIGRFISPDSIVPDPADPQSLNRYAYCRNNPLIYTDPTGHDFGLSILIGAAIGAAIGGASAAINDGDVLEGVLLGAVTGAITAGFFHGAHEIIAAGLSTDPLTGITVQTISSTEQAVIHAGAGAFAGGINSAITDHHIGLGMLVGGISGGIGKYAGGLIPQFEDKTTDFIAQLTGRSVIGGITGGIAAEIHSNGRFMAGFAYGAGTAAFGFLFNDMRKSLEKLWYSPGKNPKHNPYAWRLRPYSETPPFDPEQASYQMWGTLKIGGGALMVTAGYFHANPLMIDAGLLTIIDGAYNIIYEDNMPPVPTR
jgi:RHS repeat-associated protein